MTKFRYSGKDKAFAKQFDDGGGVSSGLPGLSSGSSSGPIYSANVDSTPLSGKVINTPNTPPPDSQVLGPHVFQKPKRPPGASYNPGLDDPGRAAELAKMNTSVDEVDH